MSFQLKAFPQSAAIGAEAVARADGGAVRVDLGAARRPVEKKDILNLYRELFPALFAADPWAESKQPFDAPLVDRAQFSLYWEDGAGRKLYVNPTKGPDRAVHFFHVWVE